MMQSCSVRASAERIMLYAVVIAAVLCTLCPATGATATTSQVNHDPEVLTHLDENNNCHYVLKIPKDNCHQRPRDDRADEIDELRMRVTALEKRFSEITGGTTDSPPATSSTTAPAETRPVQVRNNDDPSPSSADLVFGGTSSHEHTNSTNRVNLPGYMTGDEVRGLNSNPFAAGNRPGFDDEELKSSPKEDDVIAILGLPIVKSNTNVPADDAIDAGLKSNDGVVSYGEEHLPVDKDIITTRPTPRSGEEVEPTITDDSQEDGAIFLAGIDVEQDTEHRQQTSEEANIPDVDIVGETIQAGDDDTVHESNVQVDKVIIGQRFHKVGISIDKEPTKSTVDSNARSSPAMTSGDVPLIRPASEVSPAASGEPPLLGGDGSSGGRLKSKWPNFRRLLLNEGRLADVPTLGMDTSCMDGCSCLRTWNYRQDGVYAVQNPPFSGQKGGTMLVYCDMTTDGGAWTVIQNRVDGSRGFYRRWTSYADGFGRVDSEFWIGNNILYALTRQLHYQLRVEFTDWNGDTGYAVYDQVRVENESDKYRLTLGVFVEGNRGDALSYHHNSNFSTFDRDNDAVKSQNCAELRQAGFWFNACNEANPNGRYMGRPDATGLDGAVITWGTWEEHGFDYALKTFRMMIRPTNYDLVQYYRS